MDMEKLKKIILDSEEVLIEKILRYAKERNYVKYTSTLKEAWRMSIAGLSAALIKVIERNDSIPEMSPDDDFSYNEAAEFGIIEARKHRSRGITLGMFLGLMKYYRQAYVDLIHESDFSAEEKEFCSQYIRRYFDHVELGFTVEWAGRSENQELKKLQELNRRMTNEKNKYLTVFESIYDPIILVDQDNHIENINHQALELFFADAVSGMKYYGNKNSDIELDQIKGKLNHFIERNKKEVLLEKTIQTKAGHKTFSIKLKKMLDVSEKYSGTVIIFNDITDRLKIEKELKMQHEKLEDFAFTDQMTGVSNRRTGFMTLEKELSLARKNKKNLSICFMDIDGLKKVNDTYGHSEGDRLINDIVSVFKSSVREMDTISRMGGDEFLIIFPDCKEACVEGIIGQINKELESYDNQGGQMYRHSFSYGILEVTSQGKQSVNDLLKEVDAKMYENKFLKKTPAMIPVEKNETL